MPHPVQASGEYKSNVTAIGGYNHLSVDQVSKIVFDRETAKDNWAQYLGYEATWIPLWRTAMLIDDKEYVAAAFSFADDVDLVLMIYAPIKSISRGSGLSPFPPASNAAPWAFDSPERIARYEATLLRAVARGRTGEEVGELGARVEMMRRGYRRVGEGIFNGSGHGIDSVYRHVTSGEIAVVESKFNRLFNANRNAESLLGEGYGFRQMDDGWILRNIENAVNSRISGAQRVGAFLETNGYTQRIIVVTNQRGEVFFHLMK